MKFLKFAQAGYENYTGPIGAYEFVNGVSTTPILRHDRDRLAVAFVFVEFEYEGGEEIFAGVAQRMVTDAGILADDNPPTQRQTEEEKDLEQLQAIQAAEGVKHIHSASELEHIADKKGIAGLREVAQDWGVKHRSIPDLIMLIVEAQNAYLKRREEDLERRGLTREAFLLSLTPIAKTAPVSPVNDDDADTLSADAFSDDEEDYDTPDPVEIASPEMTDEQALKVAAATGNIAAAVSGE